MIKDIKCHKSGFSSYIIGYLCNIQSRCDMTIEILQKDLSGSNEKEGLEGSRQEAERTVKTPMQ